MTFVAKIPKNRKEKKALSIYCPSCGQVGNHWQQEQDDSLECENCGFSH